MIHQRIVQIFALAAVLSAQPAWAYLGGFENADGYDTGPGIPLLDVSSYNAGQYGTNGGGPGGGPVSITPNTGLFVKYDVGNISPGYGELVAHQTIAHTGSASLVLRSSASFGDTGGDGANYVYSFDSRDFGGVTPTSVTSGVISLDYWMCPQTSFFQTGTVSNTAFLNPNGDTLFAVGTLGQGIFSSEPYMEWQDVNGWHTTTLLGNNAGWDHIMLQFKLNTDTGSFAFYSSLTGVTTVLANNVPLAAPSSAGLAGINFVAQPNTEKNAYDDFNIVLAVPEPSSLVAVVLAVPCIARRRRVR